MIKGSLYSDEEYKKVIDHLIEYAHEDWLGFSVISPKAARLAGPDTSLEERIPAFRKIVSDLLDAGADIGDFADTEGAPFTPWPGTKEEHLTKVENDIQTLGKSPMSGDIGWIFFTESENQPGQ